MAIKLITDVEIGKGLITFSLDGVRQGVSDQNIVEPGQFQIEGRRLKVPRLQTAPILVEGTQEIIESAGRFIVRGGDILIISKE